MANHVDLGRRKSLIALTGAVATLPLIWFPNAQAADEVTEDDKLAQQLGYVGDASSADTERFPKRAEPGGDQQFCRTCQFFQGEADSDAGGCAVFGGRTVQAGAWCSSWFKKAG